MRKQTMMRSFKIPASIVVKINKKLVADGYGLRGKSQWLCDAIKYFLSKETDFCIDCVQYTEDLEQLDKTVSFRSTQEIDDLLKRWVIILRKKIPEIEGTKSKIIRAAVLQGLLCPGVKSANG